MKIDFCQDINWFSSFSMCLNGEIIWRKCSIILWHLLSQKILFMSWWRNSIKEVGKWLGLIGKALWLVKSQGSMSSNFTTNHRAFHFSLKKQFQNASKMNAFNKQYWITFDWWCGFIGRRWEKKCISTFIACTMWHFSLLFKLLHMYYTLVNYFWNLSYSTLQ